VRLEGFTIDGTGAVLDPSGSDALLTLARCQLVTLRDLVIRHSTNNGISLRGCSGEVLNCTISECEATGLFTLDARGLRIGHNRVSRIGNNGIQVWSSEAREDGTLVLGNRIDQIEARAGGDGQNGNGINVFRSGSVQIEANRITDCAFSAIRANSGSNCQMIGNSCERIGEIALYVEFAFEGAVIANNLVAGAAQGISVTNFNQGGRLAVVSGNLLRDLNWRLTSVDKRGIGISVEADASVTGNVVEGAQSVGILAGWGGYRRDISVTGNVIRASKVGIGASSDLGGGSVLIAQNLISGASHGGIRAMKGLQPEGDELSASGAKLPGVTIADNVVA
jgi:uncharacterized secreted repeat protein (TIGR03808 family)